MHSADICCSMAFTNLGSTDPRQVLDAAMGLTHFGGGGRSDGRQISPGAGLLYRFEANPFLSSATGSAVAHFATQGDGNRFFRSEEHTSELQSLMRISYAVLCLKKKNKQNEQDNRHVNNKRTDERTK